MIISKKRQYQAALPFANPAAATCLFEAEFLAQPFSQVQLALPLSHRSIP